MPAPATKEGEPDALLAWAERHHLSIGIGIIIAGTLLLLLKVGASPQADVQLYRDIAYDLLNGKLPYRDRVVEYPPYAIPVFLLPCLFGKSNYPAGFMMLVVLADLLVKRFLLVEGLRRSKGLGALKPLLCYSLAIPYIRSFFLQRYDIWPALITLLGVWLFCSRRYALSGAAIAAGMGIKLYPALFAPPLLILAARDGKWRSFVSGLAIGLLPIGVLSFHAPWWQFLQFHANRGIQVESLYASGIWLGKLLGLAQVDWVWTEKWFELKGPLVSAVLPWTRVLFVGTVGVSTVAAVWAALSIERPSPAAIARILLVPLLSFVAFNQVLSPQYIIWILPLAALGSLDGKSWVFFLLTLAAMLTPVFYPTFGYLTGLNFLQTVILFARNVMLVTVWAMLLKECLTGHKSSACFRQQVSG